MMNRRIPTILCVAWTAVLAVPALAQDTGVTIEPARGLGQDAALVARARALRDAGKLLDKDKFAAAAKSPVPAALTLAAPRTQPLTGRQIADRARAAYARVGWYFLCSKCDHWHFNVAGGYAIADNAIATCAHVLKSETEMREGYFVAMDLSGNVMPVTAVLARDDKMDTAILRVEGSKLTPLPLGDKIAPGDPVYLLSEPLEVRGYFSSGMVNRFFWLNDIGADATRLEGIRALRLNVSTDWAPGSSGAALLDACGNAVGHVAVIRPMKEGGRGGRDRFNGATLITLHEAIPARSVMLLARSLDEKKPMAGAAGKDESGRAKGEKAAP